MPAIYIFVYLQLLDFLTTVAGLKAGASEASPFIAKLIHISSPVYGVAVSKVIGRRYRRIMHRDEQDAAGGLGQLLVCGVDRLEPLYHSGRQSPRGAVTFGLIPVR